MVASVWSLLQNGLLVQSEGAGQNGCNYPYQELLKSGVRVKNQ